MPNQRKYDATCRACGRTRVVTLPGEHERGDVVKLAHNPGTQACGEYAEHRIEAELTALNRGDAA